MGKFDDINIEEYIDTSYLENIELKYNLTIKGNNLIDKKQYDEAIDFYSQLLYHELFINDYHPFLKLSKIYHELGRYEEELKILSDFFSSGRYCRKSTFKWFINRLKVLCYLGYLDKVRISELERRYNLFGLKNRKLSKIPVPLAVDIKSSRKQGKKELIEYSTDLFDDFLKLDPNSSIQEKIKFKYKLITKGEKFIENKEYSKAFAYYTRLLTHELFINDYHPYRKLCRVCMKNKRRDVEVKVIIKFFKSGIYCNKRQLKWFEKRLKQLSKYGYFNFYHYPKLESDFLKNGDLNENLSNTPVPISITIKRAFEMLGRVSEEEILESLIQKIPNYENNVENVKNELIIPETNLNNPEDNKDVLDMSDRSINSKERQQMIIVLNAIEEGKSMNEAAKIAGCPRIKLTKWINDGKRNKNENTTYFFKELVKIEKNIQEKKNNEPNFKPVVPNVVDKSSPIKEENSSNVKVDEVTEFNVDVDDDQIRSLISKFNDYLKNPFYKMDIRQFNLTSQELENIKKDIYNDIIQKKIVDDNFKVILKDYCKKYSDDKNKLDIDEFNSIFDKIDISKYDKSIVEECKSKTIDDYNCNKINKNGIESRFNYYYKRKIRELEQLNELNLIKKSSDPLIRKYLKIEEQNIIFQTVEDNICSEQGLKKTVLEFVTNLMNMKIERNKSDARKKLASFRFNRKFFIEITNLKVNQIEGFTKQMEYYIDKNRISIEDINEENLQKLSLNYMTYGGIFEGAENGI